MASALERISIRWRLAIVSAALTFVILAGFAVVIGQLTASRVRSDFNNQVAAAVDDLSDRFSFHVSPNGNGLVLDGPDLDLYAASTGSVIRVLQRDGRVLDQTKRAPNFGILLGRTAETGGYRVETRFRNVPVKHAQRPFVVSIIVQYGRQTSVVEATVKRIRLFLAGGVLGGTLLALLGGLIVGRRAMAPIAALTAGARDIARDPRPRRDAPAVRGRRRGRRIGKDAPGHARRPRGIAQRDAGGAPAPARSSSRTRRTSCARRSRASSPTSSCSSRSSTASAARPRTRPCAPRSACAGSSATCSCSPGRTRTATSRTARPTSGRPSWTPRPSSARWPTTITSPSTPSPRVVDGARDELHRMALNLMENAVRHTPPGSRVHATVRARDGEVVLTVEDDGPGVPADLRPHVFERFVRGDGDRGSSSGLGLSIVRAVAESHGGRVDLEDAHPGARFVVHLPLATEADPEPETETDARPEPVVSVRVPD